MGSRVELRNCRQSEKFSLGRKWPVLGYPFSSVVSIECLNLYFAVWSQHRTGCLAGDIPIKCGHNNC